MINIDLLQELLIVSTVASVVTVAFIQKTKSLFKKSKVVSVYSFLVNIVFGVLFTITFTEIKPLFGLWVGLFSYLEADTLYKSLEGKLSPLKDLNKDKEEVIEIPRSDI